MHPKQKISDRIKRARELAERDPEKFVQKGKLALEALGNEVERAYQKHRRDPNAIRRAVRNRLIRAAARSLR